jgi:acyl carrier protein
VDLPAARKVIAEHLAVPCELIQDDAEFRDLGADSLDLITLTMAFEEEFDVKIADDQVEHCSTVGDALGLLRESMRSRLELQAG